MAKIHELNCEASRKNTGFGGCPVDWDLIVGCILYDSPQSFTKEELADLQTTLQTQAWSDTKADRAYPIHNFLNPTDASEDPVYQTFSDGSQAKVRDGVNKWSFQVTAGGFCLLQALQTHNSNGNTYVIFYDKTGKILGTSINGLLSTIPLQVFNANTWKMNTGQAVSVYMITFIFDPIYVNQDAEYTKVDFNMKSILGLQDIKLIVNSFNQNTGAANVTVATECGGANLYDKYNADLTDDLWLFTNKDTGALITVTSVTPQASDKTFNVIIDASDPDFPTSGAIAGTLAAPSVLDAAGISGYEAEVATLEVVAS